MFHFILFKFVLCNALAFATVFSAFYRNVYRGRPAPGTTKSGDATGSAYDLYDRYLLREQLFNADDLRAFVEANRQLLDADKKPAYDTITNAVASGRGGLYFLDAPGGTGKTFISLLLTQIRSQN